MSSSAKTDLTPDIHLKESDRRVDSFGASSSRAEILKTETECGVMRRGKGGAVDVPLSNRIRESRVWSWDASAFQSANPDPETFDLEANMVARS